MRRSFAKLVHEAMSKDDRIYVVTADLGFGLWNDIQRDFPDRFVNVGAAEQLMIGLAIGLQYQGKIPLCYSISPFLYCRPFELIRTYVDHEDIPIKLVGSGRDRDYHIDGYSHFATDDVKVLSNFDNILKFFPNGIGEMSEYFEKFIYCNKPSYMGLSKKVNPNE